MSDMLLFIVARCPEKKEGQGLGQGVGVKENSGERVRTMVVGTLKSAVPVKVYNDQVGRGQ